MNFDLHAAIELSAQTAGQLFWIRQDVPIESLLPRRKECSSGAIAWRDIRKPEAWSRAANFSSTGGYGYQTVAGPGGNIAVFNINGLIAPSAYADPWDDGCTVSDLFARDIIAATNDPEIAGGLFVINSPGGYVEGSYELAEAVAAMTAAKPTASFVTSLAASAAYLQAAQTGSITAYKTAYVGSIGTRSVLVDASGYFTGAGIRIIPVDSGGMKSAGLIGTPITDEQKAYFQSLTDKSNAFFVDAVASGRSMTGDKAKSLADGKVHLAADAKSLGLIDAVGSMDDAMEMLTSDTPSGPIQRPNGGKKRNSATASDPVASDRANEDKQKTAEDVAADSGASASGAGAETQAGQPQEVPMAGTQKESTAGDNSAQAQAAEAKPATLPELRKAFGNHPNFAMDCYEKGLTLTEAKADYSDLLQKELEQTQAANKKLADEKAESEKSKSNRRSGTDLLASTDKKSGGRESRESRESNGDPQSELKSIIDEKAARFEKRGMDPERARAKAYTEAKAENPDLVQDVIDDGNSRAARKRELQGQISRL